MRMIVLPLTLLCFLGFGIATAHSGPSGPYIVTVGDSIVQTYPVGNAIYGWGQTLPGLFNSQVQWTNWAVSGESTSSYIAEGLWGRVLASRPDWAFIEFGHNDSHDYDPTHYTDPNTTFRTNLTRMVTDLRAIDATPVFVTPTARRIFDGNLVQNPEQLQPYADAMMAVGCS